MDFSDSKENARMLVERFLETKEQPDFMEYLCFKNCYVEAEFKGYGIDYVLQNFCVYAGINQYKEETLKESTDKFNYVNKVIHTYCPCTGDDIKKEAKKYGLTFELSNGKLKLIKDNHENINHKEFSYNAQKEKSLKTH